MLPSLIAFSLRLGLGWLGIELELAATVSDMSFLLGKLTFMAAGLMRYGRANPSGDDCVVYELPRCELVDGVGLSL